MLSFKKALVSFSVVGLLLGNCSSVLAFDRLYNSKNSLDVESVKTTEESFVFSNRDVLKAAEKLYNSGLFSKEQYQTVYAAYTQRFGIKGENKVVHLGNGLMDVYINNVTWSALISLGGTAAGLLLSAIPGINATAATLIAGIGGAVGNAYFGSERGVIARMKLVTEPATYYSGQKTYYRVISWREQWSWNYSLD